MTELSAYDVRTAILEQIKERASLVRRGKEIARAAKISFCDVAGRNLYADKHEESIDRALQTLTAGRTLSAGVEVDAAGRWLTYLRAEVARMEESAAR